MASIHVNASIKANRFITEEEKLDKLHKQRDESVEPTDRGSLLQFNSIYTEYIDPVFFLRGSTGSLVAVLGALMGIATFVFFLVEFVFDNDAGVRIVGFAGITMGLSIFYVSWWFAIRPDFFTYTAYPVRFNRKNRKIYVFRPPKEGGVQVFSWDEVGFYINRNKGFPSRHLIGHVMDGDYIKFSFAVGYPYVDDSSIKELWEFVYRYMEEPPNKIKPPFISLTIEPSIINCYRESYIRIAIANRFLQILFFPVVGPLIALRWIIFKTCKQPIWPSWVEDECTVMPNDPHYLPEPKYIGDGFEEHPEYFEKIAEKARHERANRGRR